VFKRLHDNFSPKEAERHAKLPTLLIFGGLAHRLVSAVSFGREAERGEAREAERKSL